MTKYVDPERALDRVCAVITVLCCIAFGVMLAWRG